METLMFASFFLLIGGGIGFAAGVLTTTHNAKRGYIATNGKWVKLSEIR